MFFNLAGVLGGGPQAWRGPPHAAMPGKRCAARHQRAGYLVVVATCLRRHSTPQGNGPTRALLTQQPRPLSARGLHTHGVSGFIQRACGSGQQGPCVRQQGGGARLAPAGAKGTVSKRVPGRLAPALVMVAWVWASLRLRKEPKPASYHRPHFRGLGKPRRWPGPQPQPRGHRGRWPQPCGRGRRHTS